MTAPIKGEPPFHVALYTLYIAPCALYQNISAHIHKHLLE